MSELPNRPGLAYPVPPSTASGFVLRPLEKRIAAYEEEAQSTRATFAALETVYTEARRREKPGYSLLRGASTISDVLAAAVDACRTELLTAQPGGSRSPELLERALERELPRLRAGISQRTLYQHAVRFDPPTVAYIEQITGAGAHVRTAAEIFERLIIIDREVAYIPVQDERSSTALEIRQPGIVRYLVQVFDHLWEHAVAMNGSLRRSAPITCDVQRTILRAVVSGETDESIARRIGMSRRSVAEHVRKASEQLGSNSRAQLGYLIATTGLLDAPARRSTP
ncbi:LuxR C-terminal-related transcriptional regulator [Kitasatospora sp. GP82]|uniref:LuxR C-terminal-related transcriptional regulator n=1 Tax=Kitasatospora sp. GP82 TaxID=3035089 RepID=UPI0024754E63|nr:LuxR C-terminal-related transcriptional regulator [Kitasatospora sp. GP82]